MEWHLLKCPKCGADMKKFKVKDTGGFEKLRTNQLWVCPKCGYDKEFTDREK